MCQGLVVFHPRCNHTHCPRFSSVSTCNLKTKASGAEPSLPATNDILATTVQLCPRCYQREEIAILTIYTIAITELYDRKEGTERILMTAGILAVGRFSRGYDVEIANLKIEMLESLAKLREGQGVPKMPEKQDRVKFDFRGPKVVQVKNWVGKENLWPDEDGDIELRDAPREQKQSQEKSVKLGNDCEIKNSVDDGARNW